MPQAHDSPSPTSPASHGLLNKLKNPRLPALLSLGFEALHSGQAEDSVGKLADSAAQPSEFRHITESFHASASLSLKWEYHSYSLVVLIELCMRTLG